MIQRTTDERSTEEVESDALELVRNAVILNPKLAAYTVAQFLYYRDETGTMAPLAQVLALRYLVRAVNAERRKARPKRPVPPSEKSKVAL